MSSNRLRRARGFTLVEMVIAIVVIGVGLAGVLLAFNTAVRGSADPLVHKQMLAIAEEMMEEILLKPYDSTDAPGAISGCNRVNADDVRDYAGYASTGVCDVDGGAVSGLAGYNVSVRVVSENWQGIANTLHVTVTVTHGSETLALDGWRTGYAS